MGIAPNSPLIRSKDRHTVDWNDLDIIRFPQVRDHHGLTRQDREALGMTRTSETDRPADIDEDARDALARLPFDE